MKLKQTKDDFIVEEITNFEIKTSGEFKLYSLKKSGVETINLISELERRNDISRKFIGIAGIKDKHAVTTQYVTIPKNYEFKALHGEGYSLKFLGYVNSSIEVGSLERNKFILTIRDLELKDLKNIDERIKFVSDFGSINYFDSQRFGSVIGNVFIAKFLIKEDYENALKQYFITQFNSSSTSEKILMEKKLILGNWSKFSELKLTTFDFKRIQAEYIRTKSFRSTYKMIPNKLREMFVISYQSYLWNECVKEYLIQNFNSNEIIKVKYAVGELYYLDYNCDRKKIEKIPEFFKTLGRNYEVTSDEQKISNLILKKENLTYEELKKVSKSGSFLKSQNRKFISKPINLKYSKFEVDELNKNNGKRHKIKISFELDKGSYATNIIKAIFYQ